ncbi:tRNA-binding protein [Candidatus Laterigemmans baculatus]|uniref:tRNA-binding protein n=1 Tax=Candidatus Laterigemmans baculatus TaxID=2770505 RepID=UPI00193B60D3|nr:tRNA-binding protein [Candidatus Laterigemmans baculatus]
MPETTDRVSLDDFQKLEIRVGRVATAEPFPEGKYSTHILQIDFGGELGTKKSLARLAPNYGHPELVGRQVLAVVNFPPRQIGKHRSEVLTLGVSDSSGNVVLIAPDQDVPLGSRLH